MEIILICPFKSEVSIKTSFNILKLLLKENISLSVDKSLFKEFKKIEENIEINLYEDLNSPADFLFCVGGDGSMLKAISFLKRNQIPILGINIGRLGFLTGIQKEKLNKGINFLKTKNYSLVKRDLLTIKINGKVNLEFPCALNEITVSRKNTASLISIETSIDKIKLSKYWADGLIIATPTGSTGYNLSSGGPIMLPETPSILITPIAAHNLNVRPLVIPNESIIELEVDGQGTGSEHFLSLDSKLISIPYKTKIIISKASFSVKTVQFQKNEFYNDLSEKLFWGLDKRN
ncbi:MAG: NAD(+)/NADH kinase [Flavobacteriaceae bacterium]|tara:strand:- start:15687 stop:16559 length:873 start_codon:yes stop_codon:yes gene_type:complete